MEARCFGMVETFHIAIELDIEYLQCCSSRRNSSKGSVIVRRTQDVGFIPEWERVAISVVDYVLSAKSQVVDADRLVLVGNSFGG